MSGSPRSTPTSPLCREFLGLAFLASCSATVFAAEPVADVFELNLEELMQVMVTSVSKKEQSLAETAAAAFVIQAEEIRRSGASNIPEALRLAPGVQVAAIGNNKWAISIRGQADRFSNKLLVLVDGRSVYSPFFSGVIWEALDIPLENVARIEVIRGPGASIWGANAVNGVINIITQSAFDSLGGKAAVAVGSELRGYGFARYSWQANADTAVQLHAKAHASDASRFVSGGDGADDWHNRSAGFRVDQRRGADSLHVQGGIYTSQAGDELINITPSGIAPVRSDLESNGGHLLGRWQSAAAEGRQDSIQFYVEHSNYDHTILGEQRTTLDLEFQRQQRAAPTHELTWGLGYRYSRDDIENSSLVTLPDTKVGTSLFSAFIQDEILLQPERWRLTLGARLEHNEYTGYEFQPNLRLLWTPSQQTSAWIAAARAIRTPARVERSGKVYLPISPTSVLELDNSLAREERLDALDLGWRYQFNPRTSLDLTAFHYRYESLRDAAIIGGPIAQPGGYVFIPTINSNANTGTAQGIEASLDWRPHSDWHIQAAWSLLDSRIRLAPNRLSSGYADTTPRQMLSLRVAHDLSSELHCDAWLRYVVKVDAYTIPAYTTLDLRLAWQPRKNLEVSLVGQNLLDSAHAEYGSSFILSTPSEIERGVYLKAEWTF
jgi:iron complex outermembrane receptor protein